MGSEMCIRDSLGCISHGAAAMTSAHMAVGCFEVWGTIERVHWWSGRPDACADVSGWSEGPRI